MEKWRSTWRVFAGMISTRGLKALQKALLKDDSRLIQGATTQPPPLQSVQDWRVEAACLVGYCGWQGDGLQTVGQTEEYFAKMCFDVDTELCEPAGCRHLLNWFDETPRAAVRLELIGEVARELAARKKAPTKASAALAKA